MECELGIACHRLGSQDCISKAAYHTHDLHFLGLPLQQIIKKWPANSTFDSEILTSPVFVILLLQLPLSSSVAHFFRLAQSSQAPLHDLQLGKQRQAFFVSFSKCSALTQCFASTNTSTSLPPNMPCTTPSHSHRIEPSLLTI